VKKLIEDITSKFWKKIELLPIKNKEKDTKEFILKVLFYKYLNDKQNESNKGLVNNLEFNISSDYSWERLLKKDSNVELENVDLSKAFKYSTDNLKNIFEDVQFNKIDVYKETISKSELFYSILQIINTLDEDTNIENFLLSDVIEYFIYNYLTMDGRRSETVSTPIEINCLVSKLVVSNVHGIHMDIYDPTVGIGSLLVSVGKELNKKSVDTLVNYWGQEINKNVYEISNINLIVNDIRNENLHLRNEDALDSNVIKIDNSVKKFDIVVENPPYSAHWDNDLKKIEDKRFNKYSELAPKTKADFAFILQGLYPLKNNGVMAAILPNGVLFRGSKEGIIRQKLLENNQIDAVISLPSNLYSTTSIPVMIMILKKERENKDILFIDASREFQQGKRRNKLEKKNIDKIVDTYINRKEIKNYSHNATFNEIKDNDYNLNIPRYVDTFDEGPSLDIELAQKKSIQYGIDLEDTQKEINHWLDTLEKLNTK